MDEPVEKASGNFSLRKMPKKIINSEIEMLKESYEMKRKNYQSSEIIPRTEEAEALHLEWLDIHKNMQPHEVQKKSLLLRLKSLTGELKKIFNYEFKS